MTVDAVLFDYGGVLTSPIRDSISAWLAADGIEPRSFTRVLRAWLSRDAPSGSPIHRLETGELSAAEFNATIAGHLETIDGRSVDPQGILGRLFAGVRPDPVMFALAEDLRALGVPVGLLSNSWGNSYPHDRFRGLLDPIVISSEVGLRKPQAAIYELAVARLGMRPDRVLFVDDARPNLIGARAVGLQALLHTDASATRTVLAGLVGGLRPQSTTHPIDRSSP